MTTSPQETRAALNAWAIANRWTPEQVCKAMTACKMGPGSSPVRVAQFATGATDLSRQLLQAINRFVALYPRVGDFDSFVVAVEAERIENAKLNADSIVRRRLEREQERADHQRRHLAQEHQPKRIDRGVLYGLPKDVVAALSGTAA